MNWENIVAKLIQIFFGLLFFIIPLFFLPVNYELFEFNKMILVYGFTVIIVFFWLVRSILQGQISIGRTPLDWPILIYFLSNVISTILSIEPHTSIFGYYSRFNGGLLSTICYLLLYYAFISNISSGKQKNNHTAYTYIYILLVSLALVTSWGILEHFGIDAKYWVQDVRNRVFSTLGQPNWLGAFIDSLIFIPLGLAIFKPKKSSIFYLLYIIFFLCLNFTNSKSAILAFFSGLIFFSFIIYLKFREKIKSLSLIWLGTIIIYLILGQRTLSYLNKMPLWLNIFKPSAQIVIPPANTNPAGERIHISESSDIRRVVWKGAIEIWKHYPIFGSGVETFAYSYYQHKPQEHNLLSEWDFLYNKAHNEFLNILACQGMVGLASYLFLIVSFLIWGIKKVLGNNLKIIPLLAGYITILITNFFGFSVVIIGLLLFFIPAFAFILTKETNSKIITLPFKKGFLQDGLIILSFLLMVFMLNKVINLWRADYYFNRGQKQQSATKLINAFLDLQKAVELNFQEATFHNQLAIISAKLAVYAWQSENQETKDLTSQFELLAVAESQKTLALNPVHINFYKIQAQTYAYLMAINPDYQKEVIKILETAVELAPTDAKAFYLLGMQYENIKDYPRAIESFEKTVSLKPDYRAARAGLAKAYFSQDKKDKAKAELNYILQNLDNYDKEAMLLLQEWNKL